MRDEAGTTRSQRPSRLAVVELAVAMSSTSRRFLLPLVALVPRLLTGKGEEEDEDADDEEESAGTLGVVVEDRGRRRRDSRNVADDAWAGPRALGLRKDGAAGNPLRMLALYIYSVGGVSAGCGYGVVVAIHPVMT